MNPNKIAVHKVQGNSTREFSTFLEKAFVSLVKRLMPRRIKLWDFDIFWGLKEIRLSVTS